MRALVALLLLLPGCASYLQRVEMIDAAAEPNTDAVVAFNIEHGLCNLPADITARQAEIHGGTQYMAALVFLCPVWEQIRGWLVMPTLVPLPPALPP